MSYPRQHRTVPCGTHNQHEQEREEWPVCRESWTRNLTSFSHSRKIYKGKKRPVRTPTYKCGVVPRTVPLTLEVFCLVYML